MPLDHDFDPLFGDAPEEIPLKSAPLIRVLAQVKFPEISSITKKEFISDFQEAIRNSYPLFEVEDIQVIVPTLGPPVVQTEKIWRLHDQHRHWRVTLATDFLTFETTKYETRADFTSRFSSILSAFGATIAPSHVSRVGVRYIDQVKTPELDGMDSLLRAEMLGVVTSKLRPCLRHAMTEANFSVKEGELIARWGMLPRGATYDPSVITPVPDASWVLDLDVYKSHLERLAEYDSDEVLATVDLLATRGYAFFRWAATENFLKAYGAEI